MDFQTMKTMLKIYLPLPPRLAKRRSSLVGKSEGELYTVSA
jgi:hypothetical protein